MADAASIDYFARVTGILGLAIGAAGAVTGIWGLRNSNAANRISKEANRISKDAIDKVDAMKSLDMRLELRKAITQLNLTAKKLPGIIQFADYSKKAVAAAKGVLHSGGTKRWNDGLERYKNQLSEITNRIPNFGENYEGLSPSDLENFIVGAHALQTQLNEIERYFQDSLDLDNEARKEMKADIRARFSSGGQI